MAERKRKTPKSEAEIAAAEEAELEEDVEAAEEAEPEEKAEAKEEDPVARLEAEVASLKDQLLRALAETENVRRRSQRERAEAVKYAAAPLIKDLIGVVDNLRRALDSVSPEALETDEQLKTLVTGLEMTEQELASVFERHNIVKIEPLGERLDPHYHEAMFEVPDPDSPSGTIVQVLQAGYRLHDRLLRPAQVGVAKGGPGREAEPQGEAEGGEAAAGPEDGSQAGGDGEAAPGSRVDTTA